MWLKNRSQTDNPTTTQKSRRKLKKKDAVFTPEFQDEANMEIVD
jgi:hypothetical protein